MVLELKCVNKVVEKMEYQILIKEVANWVDDYMAVHPNDDLCFHNMEHITQMLDAVAQMAVYYKLSAQDNFIVQSAVYFHDLGYYNGPADGHESRGAVLAVDFLRAKKIDQDMLNRIQQCILATQLPQSPHNLFEQIVCDADFFHLGTDMFKERDRLMCTEIAQSRGIPIEKEDWRKSTINLMQIHRYHTAYAQCVLNDKKQENLTLLKAKADKAARCKVVSSVLEKQQDLRPDGNHMAMSKTGKPKKDKDNRPARGVETMFRLTSNNNQRLSDMADNKSHILITVNSIILSVIITFVTRKITANEYLILPFVALLIVSLATIIVAILVTRPYIPNGVFSPQDLKDKKVNLLFFGNYYKMRLEAYSAGMRAVMEDGDFLYNTLIKDVYSQGVVLGKKYRLLRVAYNMFMFGLIGSVLLFIAVIISIQ
ncbi:MAG: hypothetical protein K0R59_236 [Sphingobacterium sp.]|jgi:predicted metal-dependent HD superfamily phosphohydrolase|nr:hypothetical protein [Sphingobacterium sp.]